MKYIILIFILLFNLNLFCFEDEVEYPLYIRLSSTCGKESCNYNQFHEQCDPDNAFFTKGETLYERAKITHFKQTTTYSKTEAQVIKEAKEFLKKQNILLYDPTFNFKRLNNGYLLDINQKLFCLRFLRRLKR